MFWGQGLPAGVDGISAFKGIVTDLFFIVFFIVSCRAQAIVARASAIGRACSSKVPTGQTISAAVAPGILPHPLNIVRVWTLRWAPVEIGILTNPVFDFRIAGTGIAAQVYGFFPRTCDNCRDTEEVRNDTQQTEQRVANRQVSHVRGATTTPLPPQRRQDQFPLEAGIMAASARIVMTTELNMVWLMMSVSDWKNFKLWADPCSIVDKFPSRSLGSIRSDTET